MNNSDDCVDLPSQIWNLMPSMDDFELRIMEIDLLLRPIANRKVDIFAKTASDAFLRRPSRLRPLDEAGIRPKAEALLQELIDFYHACGVAERQAIRVLFVKYRAFAWAASLSFDVTDEESFRRHLLLFSIRDQGRDSRDALMGLQSYCHKARNAGVNTVPVLHEIAEISSDIDLQGMGSAKEMLLRECTRRDSNSKPLPSEGSTLSS